MEGLLFDRYKVKETLSDRVSKVFVAFDFETGTDLVLKVFPRYHDNKTNFRAFNEYVALRSLSREPQVPDLVDFHGHAVAMEYLQIEGLDAFRERASLEDCIEYVKSLAGLLYRINEAGIICYDLNFGNLLADGNTAYLVDFEDTGPFREGSDQFRIWGTVSYALLAPGAYDSCGRKVDGTLMEPVPKSVANVINHATFTDCYSSFAQIQADLER